MRLLSFSVLFLALNSVCSANLILNGDFETVSIASGGVSVLATGDVADLTNWKVLGTVCGTNCVLVLNTNYSEGSNAGTLLFQAQSGTQSLDLTGADNSTDGGVEQSVATTIGTAYILSFYVGNMDDRAANYSGPSVVQVNLNGASQGLFSNDLNSNGQVNWALETLTFTATSNTTLIDFLNATPTSDKYAGLDNVSLDLAPTPEPSSFSFVGLAALGLALRSLAARRKR